MPNTAADGGIRPGDRVRIRYQLRNLAAETLENSELTLVPGEGTFFPLVEQQLLTARVGQRLCLTLSAEQAYGERDEQACMILARRQFDSQWTLDPGSIVSFSLPGGDEVAGQVLSLNDDWVEVDFNHPLAGQSLICELDIMSVETNK